MKTHVLAEVVLPSIPSILQALNDNPVGTMALVVLAVLAFAGYVLYKCK